MQRRLWKANKIFIVMDFKKLRAYILFLFLQVSVITLFAQVTNFPTPSGIPNQLFYLQRTPNTNTIICELNAEKGEINEEEPVHVYWLRYQEKGQRQELNFIQRKFAYGMKFKKLSENRYEIHFVSYKKQKMYLQIGADKLYHVFAIINQKAAILSRLYLHINGGTFWAPNVEYIELTGIDPSTRQVVKERKKV